MCIECSQDNKQVYNLLSKVVAEEFLHSGGEKGHLEYIPLEINDFSICFGVNVVNDLSPRGIYVKIPKADLYKKEKRLIMPLSAEDRDFAEDEYRSLMYLSKHWESEELKVEFINWFRF